MFNLFRRMFCSTADICYPDDVPPTLDDIDDVPEVDIDAGLYDHLPSDDDSLEERSRKLCYKNWDLSGLKKRRYRYLRFSELHPTIRAEASDGILRHWGTDAAGEKWYRIDASDDDDDSHDDFVDDDSHPVDDDDHDAVELAAELDQLDREIDAAEAEFHEKLDRLKVAARSRNLSYDPSASFEPPSQWEPDYDG